MNELINLYGWNTYSAQHTTTVPLENIARVTAIHGTSYIILGNSGELAAELTGKLLYSSSRTDIPKVGDWVQVVAYDNQAFIVELLPRTNALGRRAANSESKQQLIAANIDKAFIVQGLDNDFNPMRLERYLAQVIACNITPHVILTKADLVEDINPYLEQVLSLQRNMPVTTCSIIGGSGFDELENGVISPGHTYVLIGSSGAGKTSILNQLNDQETGKTQITSTSTGKGKHTTTTRNLYKLPNGGLIIDTPGMREFGIGFLDDYDEALTFPRISAFASNCYFSDCSHTTEKGCAVLQALKEGLLSDIAYQSYLKLMKEQQRFEKSKSDLKKEGKRFGKMVREAKSNRKKYKY